MIFVVFLVFDVEMFVDLRYNFNGGFVYLRFDLSGKIVDNLKLLDFGIIVVDFG